VGGKKKVKCRWADSCISVWGFVTVARDGEMEKCELYQVSCVVVYCRDHSLNIM
jgi:hypothetical protein